MTQSLQRFHPAIFSMMMVIVRWWKRERAVRWGDEIEVNCDRTHRIIEILFIHEREREQKNVHRRMLLSFSSCWQQHSSSSAPLIHVKIWKSVEQELYPSTAAENSSCRCPARPFHPPASLFFVRFTLISTQLKKINSHEEYERVREPGGNYD